MKNSFQLIYNSHKFYKLRGKWREVLYDSEYCSELDFTIHSIYLVEKDKQEDLIKDVNMFMFYQNKTELKEKIGTSFIRLIFYFSVNYESTYKQIYEEINAEIVKSYYYLNKKGTIIIYILEIGSLVLYFFFFICCFVYLYYSNIIILRNIIFLFLDFAQEYEDKNSNMNSVSDIIGKLLKFQNLLNDFNLSNIRSLSEYLDKKNITEQNNDNKDMKLEPKKQKLHDFYNKKYNINKNDSDITNNQSNDAKSKKTNNSSHNILLKSNSKLIPEKLNQAIPRGDFILDNVKNTSLSSKKFNAKNGLISPANSSSSLQVKKSFNYIKMNNINKSFMSESNMRDSFEDAVLDRSNRVIIYIIKIHSIIIVLFMWVILGYSIYKLRSNSIYINHYERFYSDFKTIEERYSSLYYYWNTLKTIMIFNHNEERWINMNKI